MIGLDEQAPRRGFGDCRRSRGRGRGIIEYLVRRRERIERGLRERTGELEVAWKLPLRHHHLAYAQDRYCRDTHGDA